MADSSRKRTNRNNVRWSPGATAVAACVAIFALVAVFTGPASVASVVLIAIGAALVALQIYLVLKFPGRVLAFVARMVLLLLASFGLPAVVPNAFPIEVPATVGMPLMLVTMWLSISVAVWGVVAVVIESTSKRTRDVVVAVAAGVLAAANFVGFMTQFDRVASPVEAVANVQFPDDEGVSTQSGHAVVLTIQVDDYQSEAHSMEGFGRGIRGADLLRNSEVCDRGR